MLGRYCSWGAVDQREEPGRVSVRFAETEYTGAYLGLVPPASTGAARHLGLCWNALRILMEQTGSPSHPYFACSIVAKLHSKRWRVYLAVGNHFDPL